MEEESKKEGRRKGERVRGTSPTYTHICIHARMHTHRHTLHAYTHFRLLLYRDILCWEQLSRSRGKALLSPSWPESRTSLYKVAPLWLPGRTKVYF